GGMGGGGGRRGRLRRRPLAPREPRGGAEQRGGHQGREQRTAETGHVTAKCARRVPTAGARCPDPTPADCYNFATLWAARAKMARLLAARKALTRSSQRDLGDEQIVPTRAVHVRVEND